MQSRVTGTTMPVLEFTLEPNESIISEAGELSWMSSAIQLTTHTQLGGGGGFFGALKRVAGGGTLFMTEYRAIGGGGESGFSATGSRDPFWVVAAPRAQNNSPPPPTSPRPPPPPLIPPFPHL